MQSADRRLWSWTHDEELDRLVKVVGLHSWSHIAKRMERAFPKITRTGKQCRERWFNHLNPSIRRDKWTLEELTAFLDCWKKHKNRWTKIS
jgi:hypothetical protein